jgi:hypothetical protein
LDKLSTKIETVKAFEKVIVACCSGNRHNAAKETVERSDI